MTGWQPEASRRSARWISREFSELLADAERARSAPDAQSAAFDVLIVGSGYGGAIAAAELAGCTQHDGRPVRIGVLERGREYLPGAFPSQLAELPTRLRGRFAGRLRGGEGLFDLRVHEDVAVVQASGLGGGSLINAGVMDVPRAEVFDARWPRTLRDPAERRRWYEQVLRMLGATADAGDNHIGRHAAHRDELPPKARVLRSLAPQAFRRAALTIAMENKRSTGGVALQACMRCGDCATGCNYGAKESLDTNLLVQAHRRGAGIYCGATVLRVQRSLADPTLWCVQVTQTDERMRARETGPRWIAARRVILAAGALGSTEILMRSRRACPALSFSPRLGQRFSTNGDMIAFGYDYGTQARANAVADEDQPPSERGIGPTITGIVDHQADDPVSGRSWPIVIEEMAVPGALRRAAEESITTAVSLQRLTERDASTHGAGHPADDPCAVQPDKIRHLSVFAAMGDDGAAGSLRLDSSDDGAGDGRLAVVWPEARRLPVFDAQLRRIDTLARGAGFGGRTLPNPAWRPLPEAMAALIGTARGPVVTVHPLGGCGMGDAVTEGVVDDCGRVFDAAAVDVPTRVHDGLVVLDGAILPTALGTNPALSIAALALRAVSALRVSWGWHAPPADRPPALTRPRIADVEAQIRQRAAVTRPGTVVGVSERLVGPVMLRDRSGTPRACRAELTLTYAPLPVARLFRPDEQGRLADARLTVGDDGATGGRLRIWLEDEWQRLQRQGLADVDRERLETQAARSYALSGTLTVFERGPSGPRRRQLRALHAWALNRGLRDVWQVACAAIVRHWRGKPDGGLGIRRRARELLRLASHAGELRRFCYTLRIGTEYPPTDAGLQAAVPRFEPPAGFEGQAIEGRKRITYARPSNPWRQLQELQLTAFGGALCGTGPPVLVLDPQYFAARGQPLLRIESQRDHVEALADLCSLSAYVLRMLLAIHAWNLRKPDLPRHRPIRRLPGRLPGLPAPDIQYLEVDRLAGRPVEIRLARYRRADAPPASADRPAALLIHGYSASGTTFAHPSLDPGLARDLAASGREVWVVDLRSSAGMPTAAHPWTFEQVALADIPLAVDHVWRRSGEHPLDVVAHCMGAVMLSMAVLSARKPAAEIAELMRARDATADDPPRDRWRAERGALPQRIRRTVLSQNGPVMVMSQQNVFRAYVMSYLEQLFGALAYTFRPEPEQGFALDLLDRLLASLPYPDHELRRENPWLPWRRTGFLGTRHRMDALYGRTFSLDQLSRTVLDHIDDLFGPLSLDTVAQVIHFAQHQTITSRAGRNRFVSRDSIRSLWTFPTLGLHGEDNGLADVATLHRLQALLLDNGRHCEIRRLRGQGHQDSLIGRGAHETFDHIRTFLDAPADDPRFAVAVVADEYIARPPWLGPLLAVAGDGSVSMGLGASPRLGRPVAVCLLPVDCRDGRWTHEALLQDLGLQQQDTRLDVDHHGDWFSVQLPAWTDDLRVRYLAVLLLYAQPRSMGISGQTPVAADRGAATGAACCATIDAAVEHALAEIAPPAEALGIVDLAWRRADRPFRAALGSCQYPPGIFNTLPAQSSWRRLNRRLDRGDGPQLLLLTGDQVYVDATAGLFDPANADDRYRKPYEGWLHDRQVRDVLRRVATATLPDDHEIDDNWQPIAGAPGEPVFDAHQRRLRAGLAGFRRFQRPAGGPGAEIWDRFEHHGVPVFLLDTRTERGLRTAADPQAPLFGPAQWDALEGWLLDPRHRDVPKLIVSPAVILPRHRECIRAALASGYSDAGVHAALRGDAWDGYPATLYRLLGLIAEREIRRVIFLSGDEHLGLLARARLRGPQHRDRRSGVIVHAIHTPGLNAPYRFANARTSDFILRERFGFASPAAQRYTCVVASRVFDGTGFTLLSLRPQDDGRWQLDCEFDAAPGAMPANRRTTLFL